MGDESPAAETAATEQTETPETGAGATQTETPIQLPDDHPLVKALKATRDELKTLRDAEKSDLQRAIDDLTAEKARSQGLETELHQLRSALKHGIPIEDVDLLGTGTADEIDGRAKRLADRTGTAAKKKQNVVPKEGTTPPASDDADRAAVRELFGG